MVLVVVLAGEHIKLVMMVKVVMKAALPLLALGINCLWQMTNTMCGFHFSLFFYAV